MSQKALALCSGKFLGRGLAQEARRATEARGALWDVWMCRDCRDGIGFRVYGLIRVYMVVWGATIYRV